MRLRAPRNGRRARRASPRKKALVAVAATLGLLAGVSVTTMAIAEPRYVAVCGDGDGACVSAPLTENPSTGEPAVAVVPLDDSGDVTLATHHASGPAAVSVLGSFDSTDPAGPDAHYARSAADLNLRFELASTERRKVQLPSVPAGARAVLIRLHGSGTAANSAAGAHSRAQQQCVKNGKPIDSCRYAAVKVTNQGAVTPAEVRKALEQNARHSSSPFTPAPGATPQARANLDAIVR